MKSFTGSKISSVWSDVIAYDNFSDTKNFNAILVHTIFWC